MMKLKNKREKVAYMACLYRPTDYPKVIPKASMKLGYRFRPPATRRLVLAAAADVMRPTETATLGARNKRAKCEEMADFRNIQMAWPYF